MQRDEKVFMVGESVRGGGIFRVYTGGCYKRFGADRVLDTPISETGIAGAGIGAALCGYRPVVDFMFSDFMFVAGDEIFLKAPQWRFLHGGKVDYAGDLPGRGRRGSKAGQRALQNPDCPSFTLSGDQGRLTFHTLRRQRPF